MRGLSLPPRLVDWTLFALVCFEVASGVVSLTVGRPEHRWLFYAHGVVGFALVVLLFWKLKRVRRRITDRSRWDRTTPVSVFAALVACGVLAWRAQSAINRLLDTPGADRRFTGSRERGSFAGNAFPTTSWVADDPDPIDPGEWSLTVDGATARTLDLAYDDLAPADRERSTLDCTSG